MKNHENARSWICGRGYGKREQGTIFLTVTFKHQPVVLFIAEKTFMVLL